MLKSGFQAVIAVFIVIIPHNASGTSNNVSEEVTKLYEKVKNHTRNETSLALKVFEERLNEINEHVYNEKNGSNGPYHWFDKAVELYYQFYNVSEKEAKNRDVNLTDCQLENSTKILDNLSQAHRTRINKCFEKYTNETTNAIKEANKSLTSLRNYTNFFEDQLKICQNTTGNHSNNSCYENLKSIMEGWLHVVPNKVTNYVKKVEFLLESLKDESGICAVSIVIDLGADMDAILNKDNMCVMDKLNEAAKGVTKEVVTTKTVK